MAIVFHSIYTLLCVQCTENSTFSHHCHSERRHRTSVLCMNAMYVYVLKSLSLSLDRIHHDFIVFCLFKKIPLSLNVCLANMSILPTLFGISLSYNL